MATEQLPWWAFKCRGQIQQTDGGGLGEYLHVELGKHCVQLFKPLGRRAGLPLGEPRVGEVLEEAMVQVIGSNVDTRPPGAV